MDRSRRCLLPNRITQKAAIGVCMDMSRRCLQPDAIPNKAAVSIRKKLYLENSRSRRTNSKRLCGRTGIRFKVRQQEGAILQQGDAITNIFAKVEECTQHACAVTDVHDADCMNELNAFFANGATNANLTVAAGKFWSVSNLHITKAMDNRF